jgi:hypothetical protein
MAAQGHQGEIRDSLSYQVRFFTRARTAYSIAQSGRRDVLVVLDN